MTKIKSIRHSAFPGDNFISLAVVCEDGSTTTVMGIWPKSAYGQRYYENDCNGETFKTIAEAKIYAAKLHAQR